jgi:N12 class adenine-specific DNA methylase
MIGMVGWTLPILGTSKTPNDLHSQLLVHAQRIAAHRLKDRSVHRRHLLAVRKALMPIASVLEQDHCKFLGSAQLIAQHLSTSRARENRYFRPETAWQHPESDLLLKPTSCVHQS